ncbi:hypothetical protein [Kitasatospora sp. GP82]|uniref:hypothetical protein n=1 Tax=Kitasatospora sp. GP82 TaxID=3035089 RepID=UPI002473DD12|nr:hypothetical protein [Kitasatospora sp. GP82]MDH6123183.1 hypothetical protein [Kitasatospora sp. GP82]
MPPGSTTDALDPLSEDLTAGGSGGDGNLAQAQIIVLSELIEATAQTAPADLRAELRITSGGVRPHSVIPDPL